MLEKICNAEPKIGKKTEWSQRFEEVQAYSKKLSQARQSLITNQSSDPRDILNQTYTTLDNNRKTNRTREKHTSERQKTE